jgi:hypothetical protein
MRVRSLKNPETFVSWDIKESSYPMKNEAGCRSKIQFKIGQILKKKYPYDPILEDVTIPESRLSFDFYLPQRKLAIEVQGEQHFEFNPFFHESEQNFQDQQKRDEDKIAFCNLNGLKLITFKAVVEAENRFGFTYDNN